VLATLLRVLSHPVTCSDETSVRVKGKNRWEWRSLPKVPPMRSIVGRQAEGSIGTAAVLHVIKPGRGKAVVTELFGDIQLEVWVSGGPEPARRAQPYDDRQRSWPRRNTDRRSVYRHRLATEAA
jgi:hypothetical protein